MQAASRGEHMNIVTDYPHTVRELEHVWIKLKDGTRLAARIWLPDDADSVPVPAIFEYLPYRKRDGTSARDALTHPWMAGQGYACLRVDIRGNGESEGVMLDEYLRQEQDDALEVIDWICSQSWSNGSVGMMGLSWGGFSCLQVAARKPKALKAIIALCATDDRFGDDVHYKGGNLLMKNAAWSAAMLHLSAAVPDPVLVGSKWKGQWLNRLDNMPLLLENWLSHQTRDSYWRHGSISEDYTAIEAAVYCISGLSDAYRNSTPRLIQKLECPKKSLIGPWTHEYPHLAGPEPTIGFLQEAKKWWDYWLKGIENGVMDEPSSTFYLQDAQPPRSSYASRPGRWIQTTGWPTDEVKSKSFYLTEGKLESLPAELGEELYICSPLTTGLNQGEYCILSAGPHGATDQRNDDAKSLCFDSEPLTSKLTILGQVNLKLKVSVDRPCGQIFIRLNAVSTGGESAQIASGSLNLNHRDGFDLIRPPVPGQPFDVNIDLDFAGYTVAVGQKLRIAISTSSFPLLWPSRELTKLTVCAGLNELRIPCHESDLSCSPFEEPQYSTPEEIETIREASTIRRITEDVGSGEVCVEISEDHGAYKFSCHGLTVDQYGFEKHQITPNDPLSACTTVQWQYKASRDNWSVQVNSELTLRADAEFFYILASQTALLDDIKVHEKTWSRKVSRMAV